MKRASYRWYGSETVPRSTNSRRAKPRKKAATGKPGRKMKTLDIFTRHCSFRWKPLSRHTTAAWTYPLTELTGHRFGMAKKFDHLLCRRIYGTPSCVGRHLPFSLPSRNRGNSVYPVVGGINVPTAFWIACHPPGKDRFLKSQSASRTIWHTSGMSQKMVLPKIKIPETQIGLRRFSRRRESHFFRKG